MGDIAAQAELSRTALYQHFKNKEEVFLAISQRLIDDSLRAIADAEKTPGPADLRLKAIMEARLNCFFDLRYGSEHGKELIDENSKICGSLKTDANERLVQKVARILSDGEKQGNYRLQSISADRMARMLIDGCTGVITEGLTEKQARKRLNDFLSIFLRGLSS